MWSHRTIQYYFFSQKHWQCFWEWRLLSFIISFKECHFNGKNILFYILCSLTFSVHQFQTFCASLNLLTWISESRKLEVENVWISICVYCFLFTVSILKQQYISQIWKHVVLQKRQKAWGPSTHQSSRKGRGGDERRWRRISRAKGEEEWQHCIFHSLMAN